jgi:hypothetical protein
MPPQRNMLSAGDTFKVNYLLKPGTGLTNLVPLPGFFFAAK